MDLATATYYVFAGLAVVCSAVHWLSSSSSPSSAVNDVSPEHQQQFSALNRRFCTVYFLALFSDWLQGPYVYKLYSSYGFYELQIVVLYVAGFASSGVFGTAAGPMADRFGRRKTCLAFCVIYVLCCLTKLSPNFYVLLVGRLLGGVATSLLFSSFEAWYVYEHTARHRLPQELMAITFSRVTFWNGLLAIVAGVAANVAAETMGLGPVAPFVMAVPVLVLCFAFAWKTWDENYGDRGAALTSSCADGLRQIFRDDRILLVGVVQSLFESVMYMFVYVWTPVLEPESPPLGIVFAGFMVCVMIGSSVYRLLLHRGWPSQSILGAAVGCVVLAMALCFLSTGSAHSNLFVPYAAFLGIEVGVGMYFPAVSYLRSNVIPESHRAGILNWFRAPMNVLTCVGLLFFSLNDSNYQDSHQVFGICFVLVAVASLVVCRLRTVMARGVPAQPLVCLDDDGPPLPRKDPL